jgi:hypothetical protein
MTSSGLPHALATCRIDVVQCRRFSSGNSRAAAIIAIASAKDCSISTTFSRIRIVSSFLLVDWDVPK